MRCIAGVFLVLGPDRSDTDRALVGCTANRYSSLSCMRLLGLDWKGMGA